MLTFEIPLRIRSAQNLREHWAVRHKRVQRERTAVRLVAKAKLRRVRLPCRVHLIRVAPRRLDWDNMVGGFKAVRDEIAALLHVDDADPRVDWVYSATTGKPYGVVVRIEETEGRTDGACSTADSGCSTGKGKGGI